MGIKSNHKRCKHNETEKKCAFFPCQTLTNTHKYPFCLSHSPVAHQQLQQQKARLICDGMQFMVSPNNTQSILTLQHVALCDSVNIKKKRYASLYTCILYFAAAAAAAISRVASNGIPRPCYMYNDIDETTMYRKWIQFGGCCKKLVCIKY